MAVLFQKDLKRVILLYSCVVLVLTFGLSRAAAIVVLPTAINFSDLTGANLQAYLGSVETTSGGTFTVTPVSGSWYQGHNYGDPGTSILDGPVGQPGDAVIEITDSQGPFTLSSLDFSSNGGDSTYDILGYLGGVLQYQETGDLPGTLGPFTFSTLDNADSAIPMDGLFIGIVPGSGVTSVNLDNIVVTTVPVPDTASASLPGIALAGIICFRLALDRMDRKSARRASAPAC